MYSDQQITQLLELWHCNQPSTIINSSNYNNSSLLRSKILTTDYYHTLKTVTNCHRLLAARLEGCSTCCCQAFSAGHCKATVALITLRCCWLHEQLQLKSTKVMCTLLWGRAIIFKRIVLLLLTLGYTIRITLRECINSGMDYWNGGMEIFKS